MRNSLVELKALQRATQVNRLFNVFADGKKVGMVTASNSAAALIDANRGLTRRTASKDDCEPDYSSIHVEPMACA
jgi:hypothetical protein